MLITTKHSNQDSVEHLVQLWAARYIPDLLTLSSEGQGLTFSDLIDATSPEGRAKTVAKVQRLLQINCECAGIKTNILFSYIPNVVNLTDAGRIALFAAQVYEKTLSLYKEQLPSLSSVVESQRATSLNPFVEVVASQNNVITEAEEQTIREETERENEAFLSPFSSSLAKVVDSNNDVQLQWVMPEEDLPTIEHLTTELEPVLRQLREQHLAAQDPRAIGFITTQFHFSTQLILSKLTPTEQVLLSPYFKFIEEQVCIPWQRVCHTAAMHALDSDTIKVVQQLLPATHEIACTVYRRAAKLYPNHRSRRGRLSNPGVAASTIRDLEMFQGYLWLCVLEGNMKAIEEELLPLCIMVFPSVDVRWDLVRKMLSMLIDELMERLSHEHQLLLLPYTQAMQQIFLNIEAKIQSNIAS